MILFILYLTALLSQTIIPESLLRFDFSSNPFHFPNWQNTIIILNSPVGWIKWMIALNNIPEIVRNIGGNIVLFIPYGFLFSCCFQKHHKFTLLYGLVLSTLIEVLQLFSDRVTDINDIILNFSGILVGYLLFLAVRTIIRKKRKKAVSS